MRAPGNPWPVYFPLMSTTMITSAPADNTVRVWHIHLRRTAVATQLFLRGLRSVMPNFSFSAVRGIRSTLFALLGGNIWIVWIQDYHLNGV